MGRWANRGLRLLGARQFADHLKRRKIEKIRLPVALAGVVTAREMVRIG
jgi:hypothetical protein